MNESENGVGFWRKLTEFMVAGEPLQMQASVAGLDKALQVLQPPAALHERLHASLANAVDRMAVATTEPVAIVRVFVAAKDILRDNVHQAPAQAQPLCWGFFLVEKRAGPTGVHTPVRPHLIEVYCYQEGDSGYQEGYSGAEA